MVDTQLGGLLSQLILSVPIEGFSVGSELSDETLINSVKLILKGESAKLIGNENYGPLLFGEDLKSILNTYPQHDLVTVLRRYVNGLFECFHGEYRGTEATLHLQLIAIAFLNTFIQVNFTGPGIDFDSSDIMFPGINKELLQIDTVRLLNLEGQLAYDLMTDPLFMVLASIIFEKLMGLEDKISFVDKDKTVSIELIVMSTENIMKEVPLTPLFASLQWWRARLLQVHMCIVSEPPAVLSTVTSLLLNPAVPATLGKDLNSQLLNDLRAFFFLESARNGIHSRTENLSIPFLLEAQKISRLQLILSGARAKRTKFQTFFTTSLIVLAKSNNLCFASQDNKLEAPEHIALDSELLLEKPEFESLNDFEIEGSQNIKRTKIDQEFESNLDNRSLLPIAFKQDDIPVSLKTLDPNNQPPLSDIDNVQLLLRLTTLKQTSPSNDPLVEEELQALVGRIVYSPSSSVNWSIFSRALWERSVLETNKAKTIERGILQMTSLVEEVDLKIKTKIIPKSNEKEESHVSSRLKYIHLLPLMPQWSMDKALAERYMSIGALKSAIEIYERLNFICEAALCYAATERESKAETMLIERIKRHPEDARAISILGDIKQDPNLWLKAWEIGRYSKAKASLAHYFYSPPQSSGLTKNLELAINNMHDCLTASPLNYDNWFFYGCCGLESGQFELASEAFTRCVAIDDSNSYAWSNLASSLLKLEKIKPAFNALKNAVRNASESGKSWRILENYLNVAAKLNEWNDVLIAVRELINMKGGSEGEASIDIPIIERLVDILVATDYPQEGERMTHFQSSCVDLVCNLMPSIITSSARSWRIVSRVELWRKKPWNALECHEKAYRAVLNNPLLDTVESVWNEAVEACSDLVAAYESLGELPGKHNAGDLICKDWKYKARTSVRSLMSKGKVAWEDTDGWNTLSNLKEEMTR
ncbi:uncharacterized protein PRCAT00004715001 [Priceomyces carsonii]|uniref:uncharacterized protein n=1 Tax=Priceomyces carsonii TaxID=28549 RepID=UPI002EDB9180|nr:unnamed protein product [Priceomyces carsonii]